MDNSSCEEPQDRVITDFFSLLLLLLNSNGCQIISILAGVYNCFCYSVLDSTTVDSASIVACVHSSQIRVSKHNTHACQ